MTATRDDFPGIQRVLTPVKRDYSPNRIIPDSIRKSAKPRRPAKNYPPADRRKLASSFAVSTGNGRASWIGKREVSLTSWCSCSFS